MTAYMPLIVVTGLSRRGWFEAHLTLGEFARARRQLQRLEVFVAILYGDLATRLVRADAATVGRERRAAPGAGLSSIPDGNHGDNNLHPSEPSAS